jgi:DNA-binding XRE family transcriptional regulator
MARKFSELRAKMSPEDQQRALVKFTDMSGEMPLHELRRARGLSQQALADVLHVAQPAIAKMEKRTDMYLSTLRSHIEAMGGVLEIVAKFPEGAVRINNFEALDAAPPASESKVA